MAEPSALRPIDISTMSDEDLENLRSSISQEQWKRKCPEFLPGSQGCDQGATPHDEHGFDRYDNNGVLMRITWKKKED